jgi:hypothetical protein
MKVQYFWMAAILSPLVCAQVPLEQEPRHHVLFTNEFLRVISPQIPAVTPHSAPAHA